jgi:hypothetical protein
VVKEQITTSGRRTAPMLGQVSRTIQEVQRPLLTPDECLRMPGPKKNAQGEIEEAGDMVCTSPATRPSTASNRSTSKTRVPGPRRDPGAEGQRPLRAVAQARRQGRASRYEPHPETHRGRRPSSPAWPPCCWAAGGYAAGARINTTKSIPVGLYWTSSAPVEKGAYVLFCPPQARRVR